MMRRLPALFRSTPIRSGALVAALVLAQASFAQVTPGGTPPGAVPRPAPVQSTPLPPPPGAQEAQAPQPAPAQPAPPTTTRTVAPLPTLIPSPGDPTDVQEVVIPSKPVAILSGV